MNEKINLQKLTFQQLISLFKKTGLEITEEDIQNDISNGLPLNNDKTIDLLVYTAFLIREINEH